MNPNVFSGYAGSTITAIGDSLTDLSPFFGPRPTQAWPAVLAASLKALGKSVKARNYGTSGNITSQMLARVSQMTYWDVPTIGMIFGGVNDPYHGTTVNGSGATTTSIPVASGTGAVLAGGYVIIGGQSRLVQAVVSDTLTLASPLSAAPANGAAVSVDTQANITAMIDFLTAGGCQKVVVNSAHYLNFSSGGDTQSVDYATYVPVRAAQLAAAQSRPGVAAFCDLHAFFSARIAGGLDTQGSNSWHAIQNNQHLNVYGEGLVAAAVLATLQAQSNWLSSLPNQ